MNSFRKFLKSKTDQKEQPNYKKFWSRYVLGEAQNPNENMVIRLTVFDFDGTLFRSPEKPKGYKGNWWASKESLAEPNVEENPDLSYWFKDTITAAREAIDNKKTFSMMLSGRLEKNFGDRVADLLEQQGLEFNLVKLNDSGNDTVDFKIKQIKKVLQEYPKISLIEIWDDKAEHLQEFESALTQDQTKVVTHHVEKVLDEANYFAIPKKPIQYTKEVGDDISDPKALEKNADLLSKAKLKGFDIVAGMGRSSVIKDAFENAGIRFRSATREDSIKKIISEIPILKNTTITKEITYGTQGELYKLSNDYYIKFFTGTYNNDFDWYKKLIDRLHSGKASENTFPAMDYGEVDLSSLIAANEISSWNDKLYWVVTPEVVPFTTHIEDTSRDSNKASNEFYEILNAFQANYHTYRGDRKATLTRTMESLKSIGIPKVITRNEANEIIKMLLDFEEAGDRTGDLHIGNFAIFKTTSRDANPVFTVIDI